MTFSRWMGLVVVLASCGLPGPASPGTYGTGGSGGSGGTGGSGQADGLVAATIDGSYQEFRFSYGGVTPDDYTSFTAQETNGPSLTISFAGVKPGPYDCSSGTFTRIDYVHSPMQASSDKAGSCNIWVDSVGAPGEPIRGSFFGTLTTKDGGPVDVTDGTFNVPNVIP